MPKIGETVGRIGEAVFSIVPRQKDVDYTIKYSRSNTMPAVDDRFRIPAIIRPDICASSTRGEAIGDPRTPCGDAESRRSLTTGRYSGLIKTAAGSLIIRAIGRRFTGGSKDVVTLPAEVQRPRANRARPRRHGRATGRPWFHSNFRMIRRLRSEIAAAPGLSLTTPLFIIAAPIKPPLARGRSLVKVCFKRIFERTARSPEVSFTFRSSLYYADCPFRDYDLGADAGRRERPSPLCSRLVCGNRLSSYAVRLAITK